MTSLGPVGAINGGRLLELHRDWAVIDVPVHGSQRTFYRRTVDAAKISLPWEGETSSRQPAAFGRQESRKGRMPILSMPHRRSQATVTQFLRDALAVDELGVPELEARARATGLLGERQSIT